jgi:hypothetical protein
MRQSDADEIERQMFDGSQVVPEKVQPGVTGYLGRLEKSYRNAPPLTTVQGIPDFDLEVVRRIRHTLRENEKLGEWYSRTGLGRSQVLQMTRDEVSARVALAERNSIAEGVREPRGSLALPPEIHVPLRAVI